MTNVKSQNQLGKESPQADLFKKPNNNNFELFICSLTAFLVAPMFLPEKTEFRNSGSYLGNPTSSELKLGNPANNQIAGRANLQRIADINMVQTQADLEKLEWKILNTLNDEKFPIVTIAVKDSLDPKSSDQLLILTFSEIPGNKTKDSLIKQLSGLGFKADFKSMEKMNRDNMLVVVVRNTP